MKLSVAFLVVFAFAFLCVEIDGSPRRRGRGRSPRRGGRGSRGRGDVSNNNESLQLISIVPLPPYSKECIDTSFIFIQDANLTQIRVSATDLTSLIDSNFDPKKETKFIVHGFFHNSRRQWLKDMASALLQNGDYNVIIVDWGRGSFTLFGIAISNTKVVGKEIAFFINKIIEKLGFSANLVHCIGHSLGAHICGYAGQEVEGFGRITGLDPTIQYFHKQENPDEKLDTSQAHFVDVIIADAKPDDFSDLGNLRPMGHINFYVNGVEAKPGCKTKSSMLSELYQQKDNENALDPENCGFDNRAIDLFIESTSNTKCKVIGIECAFIGECGCGDDKSNCAFLEIGTLKPEAIAPFKTFHIETADESHFCKQL